MAEITSKHLVLAKNNLPFVPFWNICSYCMRSQFVISITKHLKICDTVAQIPPTLSDKFSRHYRDYSRGRGQFVPLLELLTNCNQLTDMADYMADCNWLKCNGIYCSQYAIWRITLAENVAQDVAQDVTQDSKLFSLSTIHYSQKTPILVAKLKYFALFSSLICIFQNFFVPLRLDLLCVHVCAMHMYVQI